MSAGALWTPYAPSHDDLRRQSSIHPCTEKLCYPALNGGVISLSDGVAPWVGHSLAKNRGAARSPTTDTDVLLSDVRHRFNSVCRTAAAAAAAIAAAAAAVTVAVAAAAAGTGFEFADRQGRGAVVLRRSDCEPLWKAVSIYYAVG